MQERIRIHNHRKYMTKGELDCAIRRALNNFDVWNDCTGVFSLHSSSYYEISSLIEDAVHIGAQAATGDYHQLEGEELCPPYCKKL
jgi:hypothetical protein